MTRTYIANWKMYFSFDEAIIFGSQNRDAFIELAQTTDHTIVLCPSFLEIFQIASLFTNTIVKIGAQDCSSHVQGAFTGQVSPASIKVVGASYCIIGHSEQRLHSGESDSLIAQKLFLLLNHEVIPVLCIGESLDAYEGGKTLEVLKKQLEIVIVGLSDKKYMQKIYIAYEPVWAIGTGKIPTPQELAVIFTWLYTYTRSISTIEWHFIYGGSVSETTVESFKKINHLGGFLIGGASLNFQVFKKIVSYALD